MSNGVFIKKIKCLLTGFLGGASLRITRMVTDNLTQKASFWIKAKRFPATSKFLTEEIMAQPEQLCSLSEDDRKTVMAQFQLELMTPQAYIFELPLEKEQGFYYFKIFLADSACIKRYSATQIIEREREIFESLSSKDVKIITAYYYLKLYQNKGLAPEACYPEPKKNIHFLT